VKRLLIVEDDSKQRRAIADLVGGQDLEIHMAGTGKEALEALRDLTIDCVILDLSLPDCSGFELLERLNLREDISLPPIIIYTGKDLSLSEEDRLRRYSDSIIIKGAKSPERLLDEVSLFLHRVEADRPEQRPGTATNIHDKDRVFSGRKILVVDDDLRNVFALTSALETRGFQVTVARNGIEALENLEKMSAASGVDLVLMDIMMPKMDGFEAMKRIRANRAFAQLPVIALTAKTMKGEYKRCIEAGASDYLPKPIHLANLLSVIKVWLPAEGAKH
jgi:CheY-like chemotaxis protein